MPETRAPRLEVDGVAVAAAVLGRIIDVRVDRRLNLTGSATIRCSGTQEGLPFKMGGDVKISSPAGDEAFAGCVTAVEVERYDAQHRVTTYGLLDHSWRLRHTSQAVARLDATVSGVVQELVGDAGLTGAIDATQGQYKYLLQNGNDLDYVDELVAREGLDWWCEGKKFFAKNLNADNAVTRKIKAVELERLSVRASAIRPDTVVVRGWSATHDAVSGRKNLAGTDIGAKGAMATLALKGATDVGKQVHNTASLPVIDAAEATRLAEAALLRAASTAVRAELEGPGLWAVNPGEVVEVVDGDDATGSYLVTEVQHRFADGVATSRIISGDRRPPAVGSGGTAVDSSAAMLHGIVVAEVTDLNDPDKKGRVRARFPGLDEKQESDWARVSSIAAGKGRGSSIRPEVGDEVLMAFEGGDLRKPVVLGSLFTSKTQLPTLELGGSSFTKATVLHQFGHQILMWGGSSKEGLEMQLKSGASILMDEQQIHVKGVAAQAKTLLEHGSSSIELKPDGTITIKGLKIVLNADTDVEINGMNIKAAAKTTASLEGLQVELKGKAAGTFNGGGMLELKGGIVKIN